MKFADKLAYITNNHLSEWMRTRRIVSDEISDSQAMFCCCGRLATGLHEMNCQRFTKKVNAATVKRLAHLLPGAKVGAK